MDNRESEVRGERSVKGRQNGGLHRRPNNGRVKRESNLQDDFGASYQTATGNSSNGYAHNNGYAVHNKPELLTETQAIEQHALQLASEIAQKQQELDHYKRTLAERSELERVKAELLSLREAADDLREYHKAAVATLDGKLQSQEKECEAMRARILAHVNRIEDQDGQLLATSSRLAQLEAADQEWAAKLEEQGCKLAQALTSAEHVQNLLVSTEQKLKASEEANAAKTVEINRLQQLLQIKSDTRKLEEVAHQHGYQQARAELDPVLHKHASNVAFFENQVQRLEQDKHNMDQHYQMECDKLCQKINLLTEAQKQPLAPLMDEDRLVSALEGLLRPGKEEAMQLTPAFYDQLQRLLWPNSWDTHYGPQHGSVPEFLGSYPHIFAQLPDSKAFYRVGRQAPFAAALPEPATTSNVAASTGKRMMTPEERTVGPPTPASSSLPGLPPKLADQLPSGSEAKSEHTHLPPAQRGERVLTHPVVLTPFLPEVLAKLNGGQLPPHLQPGLQGGQKPRARGWSQASQRANALAKSAPTGDGVEQAKLADASSVPPGMQVGSASGQASPKAKLSISADETSSAMPERHQEAQKNKPRASPVELQQPTEQHTVKADHDGVKPRTPRAVRGEDPRKKGASAAHLSNGLPPGINARQAKISTTSADNNMPRPAEAAGAPSNKRPAEQPAAAKQQNGQPESPGTSPAWSEVAPKVQGKRRNTGNKQSGRPKAAGDIAPPPGWRDESGRVPGRGRRRNNPKSLTQEAQP